MQSSSTFFHFYIRLVYRLVTLLCRLAALDYRLAASAGSSKVIARVVDIKFFPDIIIR